MKKPALVFTALFVVLAAPALAQTGASAKVTSPNDGQVLMGSIGVGGSGSAATGVKSISLFIEDTLVASSQPSSLRQNVDVGYNWDTTSAFGGGISRNGWYQVRFEVSANGGATDSSKVNVMVDNAPQTPSNFDGYVEGETASLWWSANPEPDIIGYRIEVASDGSWSVATEVTATSYSVNLQPGIYEFRVSALRSSPTALNGHVSVPSGITTLTIQAPATPGETGDGSGGTVNGGGGGRSATSGGDPRIYGRDGTASTRDVKNTSRSFSSGGLSFGGISLPGQASLPSLPGSEPFKWGTYKEHLPYSLPQGGIPLDAAPPRFAALSTTKIIPMDALRWVGAGLLMIVAAMMLQFVGWRAETIAKLGSEGAAPLKLSSPKIALSKVALPTVSFKVVHVCLRRIQHAVRAALKKARGS